MTPRLEARTSASAASASRERAEPRRMIVLGKSKDWVSTTDRSPYERDPGSDRNIVIVE